MTTKDSNHVIRRRGFGTEQRAVVIRPIEPMEDGEAIFEQGINQAI